MESFMFITFRFSVANKTTDFETHFSDFISDCYLEKLPTKSAELKACYTDGFNDLKKKGQARRLEVRSKGYH